MPIVLVLLSVVVNAATSVFVPMIFIFKQPTLVFGPGYELPLVAYGFYGLMAYVMINFLSAQRRPGGEVYYHLDLWPSLIAALVILGTATAIYGFDVNKDYAATLPNAQQFLGALVVNALIEIFFNQRANAYEMFARIAKKQTLGPSAPSGLTRLDSPERLAAAGLAAGLIPQTAHMRLIIEPYLKTRDGLVPWTPQIIEHDPGEPPGGGREEIPGKTL